MIKEILAQGEEPISKSSDVIDRGCNKSQDVQRYKKGEIALARLDESQGSKGERELWEPRE